ncbi:MAG: hypothetical protein OFPI_26900 [Osedax symbiont Rs2]|nr:MAG: hypothetical protein OFPI_26900 [Osedax symbiont Rs2]
MIRYNKPDVNGLLAVQLQGYSVTDIDRLYRWSLSKRQAF